MARFRVGSVHVRISTSFTRSVFLLSKDLASPCELIVDILGRCENNFDGHYNRTPLSFKARVVYSSLSIARGSSPTSKERRRLLSSLMLESKERLKVTTSATSSLPRNSWKFIAELSMAKL
jgi:hypothetical protein